MRDDAAPDRPTTGRSLISPLGHYLRDSGERPLLSDRVTSLLAFHRVVTGAALEGRLWGPGAELRRRALLLRLRSSAHRMSSFDTSLAGPPRRRRG